MIEVSILLHLQVSTLGLLLLDVGVKRFLDTVLKSSAHCCASMACFQFTAIWVSVWVLGPESSFLTPAAIRGAVRGRVESSSRDTVQKEPTASRASVKRAQLPFARDNLVGHRALRRRQVGGSG